jgi:hypothetical protein
MKEREAQGVTLVTVLWHVTEEIPVPKTLAARTLEDFCSV